MIPPGGTIGIMGGGQLGRMLAVAAANLGYRTHIYAPGMSGPATEVAARWTQSAYDDAAAVAAFAAQVDVVTYEFENVDVAALPQHNCVHPPAQALEVAQDRLVEKSFAEQRGARPAPYRKVDSLDDLRTGLGELGGRGILKTRRFGYDGKGQAKIRAGDDLAEVWDDLGTRDAILEAFVPFEREVSVIAARGADGRVVCFDVTENEHRDHILKYSHAPARIPDALAARAREIAETIGAALGYVGVFAVELFVVPAADGPSLVVNEIAPRVHNSGHWTLDGASISQFEQHIRAIAGWPLGQPLRHGEVTMTNLIGDDILDYAKWLEVPGATVHLYGKGSPRPGRKMGHVTEVKPRS